MEFGRHSPPSTTRGRNPNVILTVDFRMDLPFAGVLGRPNSRPPPLKGRLYEIIQLSAISFRFGAGGDVLDQSSPDSICGQGFYGPPPRNQALTMFWPNRRTCQEESQRSWVQKPRGVNAPERCQFLDLVASSTLLRQRLPRSAQATWPQAPLWCTRQLRRIWVDNLKATGCPQPRRC